MPQQARDARGGHWLAGLAADSGYALRRFRRNAGTTIAMLCVLAIGISISTGLFSILHSYSVQPPPGIDRADDLVRIRGSLTMPGEQVGRSFSYEEVQAYQSLAGHFSEIAGWTNDAVSIDVGEDEGRQALSATASFVTENYFAVLGVQPIVGPGLAAAGSDESAAQQVAIIAHTAWDQLFGKRPETVGATLTVNGIPVTIVGVAPPRFLGVNRNDPHTLWLPRSSRHSIVPHAEPDAEAYDAVARLRPGVSLSAATSAVQVVSARVAASLEDPVEPSPMRDRTSDVVPLVSGSGDPNYERLRRLMTAAFVGLGLLVLIVTCTNVSSLLAGLAIARRREVAVRLSMGAARTRLIRQLLTESVLLAIAAGVAALALYWTLQEAVIALVPNFPLSLAVSWPAAAFTLGVALAVGVLFGLSPALHATRLTVASALKDSTPTVPASRARLQRGLVVAQIAFTQPLIVGVAAMLLVLLGWYPRQGLTESGDQIISLGLRPASAVAPIQTDDSDLVQRSRRQMRRLLDRLEDIPGVTGAVLDLRSTAALDSYTVHPEDGVEGGLQESFQMSASLVAPGYFAVRGIPIVLGREFTPTDAGFSEDGVAAEIPMLIGGDLARRLWPGANPIGRRLRPPADSPRGMPTLSVIGVVEESINEDDRHRIYLPPDSARAASSFGILIRTASSAQPLFPTIRTVVRDESPDMTIGHMRTVAEMETNIRRVLHATGAVLAGGGFLALSLSAIGLYAVLAFAVRRRTSEIAIRMVAGARPGQVVGRVVADGLRLSVLGLIIGLPFGLGGLRILLAVPDFLPAVALGPVGAMATLGALAVATAASWIPAQRAAHVDPATALRDE